MTRIDHFARGRLLLEQSRYGDAEREFRQALVDDPNQAEAHSLLALCLVQKQAYAEATEEAGQAVHLDPENWFGYYALSIVYADRKRYDEAAGALDEALRLAPTLALLWGHRAAIQCDQEQWQAALVSAETGLQFDAEDPRCTNLRAVALVKLGRKKEAEGVVAEALQRDPDNPFSHANQGWTLLEQGRIREAKEHFREALRLDPELGIARGGMLEALKAGNPVYRLLLNYFLWMAKLSPGARWGVVIGMYVAFRILGGIGRTMPEAEPYVRPLLWAYIVFALFTWLGSPVFNLVLRLNRYGRYLLSPDQRKGSNLVGLCLLGALLSAVAGLALESPLWLYTALGCGLFLLPASAIYNCDAGWPRTAMTSIAGGLALCGLAAWSAGLAGWEGAGGLAVLFMLGCALSTWVANWLTSAEVRH